MSVTIDQWDVVKDYKKIREITRKLLSSHYFILDRYLKSDKEIKPAFQKGEIKEVVVFQKDFAQKIKTEGIITVILISTVSKTQQ